MLPGLLRLNTFTVHMNVHAVLSFYIFLAICQNIIPPNTTSKITDKDIIFGNSKIKYTQTKVPEGITKKRIQDRLTIFLKNENIAKEATNFIYSERESKINTSIKITNTK